MSSDPPDQECTHDPVIIQQDQDFPGELDDNMDIIIHSDPPEQVQEDPRDNHQDDQGPRLNNLSCNGQRK